MNTGERQNNMFIEDYLAENGFKTDRNGDVVRVFKPSYRDIGEDNPIVDGFELYEINTMNDAVAFVTSNREKEDLASDSAHGGSLTL